MNFLYLGKYKKRFSYVTNQLKNLAPASQVLELCFGDTYIAHYCKRAGHSWKGFDLNEHFVAQANGKGYDASFQDLTSIDVLPKADVCIMIGSLYHFHPNEFSILSKMFNATDMVILSEPVLNLSSQRGIIGLIARRAANAGKGNEEFRFTKDTLLAMLNKNSISLNYRIETVMDKGKDLIVTLIKNGKN